MGLAPATTAAPALAAARLATCDNTPLPMTSDRPMLSPALTIPAAAAFNMSCGDPPCKAVMPALMAADLAA